MGDKDAVAPLIERRDLEGGRLHREIHRALMAVTHENFAPNPATWRAWWRTQKPMGLPPAPEAPTNPEDDRYAKPKKPGPDEPTYYGRRIFSQSILYVLDLSKSMETLIEVPKDAQEKLGTIAAGQRIKVAKTAIVASLQKLDPRTRFTVVFFSTKVRPWKDGLVVASGARDAAIGAIESAGLEDETNIYGALRAAVGLHEKPTLAADLDPIPDTMYFLTDGTPTRGEITEAETLLSWMRDVNRFAKVEIHVIAMGNTGVDLDLRRLPPRTAASSSTSPTRSRPGRRELGGAGDRGRGGDADRGRDHGTRGRAPGHRPRRRASRVGCAGARVGGGARHMHRWSQVLAVLLLALWVGAARAADAPDDRLKLGHCGCDAGQACYHYLRAPFRAPEDPCRCGMCLGGGSCGAQRRPEGWPAGCMDVADAACFWKRHAASWGLRCSQCATDTTCTACDGLPKAPDAAAKAQFEKQLAIEFPDEAARKKGCVGWSKHFYVVSDIPQLKVLSQSGGPRVVDAHEIVHLYLQRAEQARADFVAAFGDELRQDKPMAIYLARTTKTKDAWRARYFGGGKTEMVYAGADGKIAGGFCWNGFAASFDQYGEDRDLHAYCRHAISTSCSRAGTASAGSTRSARGGRSSPRRTGSARSTRSSRTGWCSATRRARARRARARTGT
jgi:hypothetical protein